MKKSLRQIATELEISPAYLSMILSGQRKCPKKLQGALPLFTGIVHKSKLNGAWEAGTLPAELLPHVWFALDFTLKGDAKSSHRAPAF